jgi:anti-sigma-K factor RskA
MTGDRHISQEELALHAMQALSSEESAAVRLHLSECSECRDHLAEISGDMALVAMSVEQHPVPEGARQRFIARIAAATAAARPEASGRVVSISKGAAKPKNSAWVAWMAVAALLVLSAVLGIKIYFLNQQIEMDASLIQARTLENRRAREVLEVLTAPAAQHVLLTTGKTPPAPSARAVYLASRGALVLQASNMQPLPENKTYELWVIPATGAPIPAGLFRPDASGGASVVLPSIPQGVPAKAFGITIENAGGSTTPTAPIILSGAAPASGE